MRNEEIATKFLNKNIRDPLLEPKSLIDNIMFFRMIK